MPTKLLLESCFKFSNLKVNLPLHSLLPIYRAIALDGRNAIFYCNRAAVHSKINNYQQAIADGLRALQIDPTYSKAYARLG